MAQTAAALQDVMKEVFTADMLEKQFYDEVPFLDRLEKTDRHPVIGKKAVVPIHSGRSGGTTVTSNAGSSALNPADAQKVARAEYNIAYNWQQISIQTGALNEAHGGNSAATDALALEVTGAVSDLRKQVLRQFVGNGDALIALCAIGGASTTVNLAASGYGYDAIVRGQLYPGQTIDIGTTANETSIAADRQITAVSQSATAPTITISGAAVTTDATHYISLANSRSGTTSYESAGLRNIAGSATASLGGLSPSTSPYWKPASVDTTTTDLSLDLLLDMQTAVAQVTGDKGKPVLVTSYKQRQNLYAMLQQQVRFSTDDKVGAGNVRKAFWGDVEIMALADIPDRELYMLSLSDLLLVTGKHGKPQFVSELEGTNKGLGWVPGTTSFVDALWYGVGLGASRRNTHAAAVGLTA